jgi:hypothetical protein
VDEVARIQDTISDYAPVLIAPLSIQIRRAGVQKKFSEQVDDIGRQALLAPTSSCLLPPAFFITAVPLRFGACASSRDVLWRRELVGRQSGSIALT